LEILDRSLAALNERFNDDAWVRSIVLMNLAQLYYNYGHQTRSAILADQALALRRTLPEWDAAEECNLLRQAAMYWFHADNLARAAARANEALEVARRSLADENPAAIEAVCARAEIDLRRCDYVAATAGFEDALRRSRAGPERVARIAHYHERLARIAESMGQRDQALVHAQQAATLSESALGTDHALTRNARIALGRLSRAANDPDTANSVLSLLTRGRCADAERLLADQLENLRLRFGSDSPHLGATLRALATVMQLRGNLDGAVGLLRSLYFSERELFYSERPDLVCGALFNLSAALWARDGLEATLELYEDASALHALAAQAAPDDRLQDAAPLALGLIELGRGRPERAEALLRECLAVRLRVYSERHHLVGYAEGILALALLRQNRIDEAETLATRAYAICATRYGAANIRTHDIVRILIEVNDRRGDASAAETLRERLKVCAE
jgi:tetratricopeptide (TPR) repeat protein